MDGIAITAAKSFRGATQDTGSRARVKPARKDSIAR